MNEQLECMSNCVISVIGPHAGDSPTVIFEKKIQDIKKTGSTFWIYKSPKATPLQVREMCNSNTASAYVIFVSPATKSGTRATTIKKAASEFSVNGEIWMPLHQGIHEVTGKLDRQTSAFVFDMLTVSEDNLELDLWDYAEFKDNSIPLKLMLGSSTICAVRKDMTHHQERMKSHLRDVIAIGRLVKPSCVWVR